MPRNYLCALALLPLAALASPNASLSNGTFGNEEQDTSSVATSCAQVCDGFQQLQRDANASKAETLAEFCLEMQLHAETVSCVLATQQDVCASAKKTLKMWRSNCSARSGFDIDIAAVGNFTGSACSTCAAVKGASKLSTNWAISRATCEGLCNVDARCSAYDFYTLVGICRTWRHCGASERLSTQCTWGIFQKPGAVNEPVTSSSSGTSLRGGSTLQEAAEEVNAASQVEDEEHELEEDGEQEDDDQSGRSGTQNNDTGTANISDPAFGIAEKGNVDESFLSCRPAAYLRLLLAAATLLGLACP